MEEEKNLIVKDFNNIQKRTNTQTDIYTTIEDQKTLFNLENACDYKINDCKGEKIRIKDVVIKINNKPLAEPVVDSETGEVIKDHETTMVTIIIDDIGKSYVTASKIFTMQMLRYVQMFGIDSIKNGLDIEIIEKSVKNSANKALGFKLV